MGDRNTEERRSIREHSKPQKKYGSTSNNHIKRQEHFITHFVSESDTLQGIALKYEVTMEQIRRANRLYASDSLFLRESLQIPMASESSSTMMSPSTEEFLGEIPSPPTTSTTPNGIGNTERTIDDFLGKIDSSIATTKRQVKKSQGNSEFCDYDEPVIRTKATMSRLRSQHNSYQSDMSSAEALATPQAVVMTQGRKVRSSLQRHEKEQDEMFEL